VKAAKHRLDNAETSTLCPTMVLQQLSYYKNYDKFTFRLPFPLKKWVVFRGGGSYLRKLIIEDLERQVQNQNDKEFE